MGCVIKMLDEDTGETRDIADDRAWHGDDGCEFHWTEGGYACCNRAHFFYPDGSVTTSCDSGRFTILSVTHEDGSVETDIEYTRPQMLAMHGAAR